ncbi:hypothetical protein B0F90DRAFT_1120111 [Multifurca ochricompacta]|uniref:Uncharacterized protein n=1 Tax=Multifurca ochricompacta TaxID=376703 RepID=A0AAD4QLA8_9AGAM|nr:hypothetical protein B0F90DRAFT_1120111 [Multifurca ochricompacta]
MRQRPFQWFTCAYRGSRSGRGLRSFFWEHNLPPPPPTPLPFSRFRNYTLGPCEHHLSTILRQFVFRMILEQTFDWDGSRRISIICIFHVMTSRPGNKILRTFMIRRLKCVGSSPHVGGWRKLSACPNQYRRRVASMVIRSISRYWERLSGRPSLNRMSRQRWGGGCKPHFITRTTVILSPHWHEFPEML